MEAQKPQRQQMVLSKIAFDETIYPRKAHDPALVQRYADTLEVIEAAGRYIELAPDGVLLNGKHRYLAYRTRYADEPDREIPVYIWPFETEAERYDYACASNSDAGYQLTVDDKLHAAIRLYTRYGRTQEQIARTLKVRVAQVNDWLARTRKEQKDREDEQILERWLACYTESEIAVAVRLNSHQAVALRLPELQESFRGKNLAKLTFQDDFPVPLYNVWKQQEKSNTVHHFGNSEARWVENLLYLYTEPFDIVVDPFAGGGATIDLCRHRGRRYWVSDRKPIVAREQEIRRLDLLTDGLPPLYKRWGDVSLVYLDPPYWMQAAGEYSQDATDLANMPLEDFTQALTRVIQGFARKLRSGARIALLLQPTQWKAPARRYTDHVADLLRAVKLPVVMRVQCPYESQQATAQMIDWAKAQRQILVLSREFVIWERP